MAKKKVCKVKDNEKKILRNLYENRQGLRVKTLMKLTNIKQRTLYKRLNKLRDRNLVKNVFPIWKIVQGQSDFVQSLLDNDNIFELHNISYIVKLIKKPKWWKTRKNRLMRVKGFKFRNVKWKNNPYQQLINDNFVIQTYPESIIIIARKRYYSNNPYETITKAINDILDLLEWFCERMRFDFFADGIPNLEIRGNDFNRLKDYLANHYKKEGRKFLIELDKRRKVWVDYSEPFGKEANYPEGQEILEKVTKDFLLNKPLTNSELQKLVGDVAKNQAMFNKNFESHVEAIQTLSSKIKELSGVVKKLKNE